MVNTREWFNDSQWVEYGDGDGAYTAVYASGTSFTINGINVTSIYHTGRRIKLIASIIKYNIWYNKFFFFFFKHYN